MGLLEDCVEHFETENLYEVLNLEKKGFNESKLKKAYYKQALKYHPDKNANDQEATAKFQILGKIHKILSCKEKREWYDASGEVIEEEFDMFGKSDEMEAWEDYWRTLYPKVTVSKLEEFEKKYKKSAEERQDLKKAYQDASGDMDKIMDSVILSRLDDEERFKEMLNEMIESEEIKAYKIFTNETAKKRNARHNRLKKEAEEAEEHAAFLAEENSKKSKKSKAGGDFDLVAVMEERMAKRRVQGEAFLADLERKYCQPKKKAKSSAKTAKKQK